jgi:hypothetical protein
MTTLAILPFLPLLPLAVIALAAAVAGLSLNVYKLVKSGKLDPDAKLKKLDEMKAAGTIKPEEYEKARQMVLDSFTKE